MKVKIEGGFSHDTQNVMFTGAQEFEMHILKGAAALAMGSLAALSAITL